MDLILNEVLLCSPLIVEEVANNQRTNKNKNPKIDNTVSIVRI